MSFKKCWKHAARVMLIGFALMAFGCGRAASPPSPTPATVEVTVTATVPATDTPSPAQVEPTPEEAASPEPSASQQAETWAPAASPMAEEPWSGTPVAASPPPSSAPGGDWGSTGAPTPSPTQPAELRIEHFRFSHQKNGPAEPIRPGETVWANFDVTGMQVVDGHVSLHAWWRVMDSAGKPLRQFDLRNAEKAWTAGRPFDAYVRVHNKIPAGDYIFAFRIMDNFTDRTVVRRASLTVR